MSTYESLPQPNEIHVWRAQISKLSALDWREILSADEAERANRFRVPADQNRFAATRAVLRVMLARYLGLSPRDLRFCYDRFGKPALDGETETRELAFNVSHSGDFSLLAFGIGVQIGVDIECQLIARNFAALAKQLLSRIEHQEWMLKPDAVRKRELLETWTRKEAVGKALGVGVSLESKVYESACSASSDWSIFNIDVGRDYVAAVAVQRPDIHVTAHDIPDVGCIMQMSSATSHRPRA